MYVYRAYRCILIVLFYFNYTIYYTSLNLVLLCQYLFAQRNFLV